MSAQQLFIGSYRQFTRQIQPDTIHRTATGYLHTVNTVLKEGYFHTSSNNIQQTLHTMDIHPACDQS